MTKKTYGIFLTELTFLKFLIYLGIRRKICVLGAYSYIQNHGGYLQQIVNRLSKRKLIETIDDKAELLPYKDSGDFQRLTNVFYECEQWMEETFKMDSFKGRYSLACKHIISNRTFSLYLNNYNIHYLSDSVITPSLDKEDRSFHLYRFDKKIKTNLFSGIIRYVLNFLLFLMATVYCLIWILSCTRLFQRKQEIILATDYNGGTRDMKFWDHLNPDQKKTLVVVRDKYTFHAFKHLLNNYKVIFDNDGSFDPISVFIEWARSVCDSVSLFFNYMHLPPDYYRQICFLPFKRVKYRALFNKYKCRFFWGRDDYNYQHIIRSQEIRRIGGSALGCNHGIQSISMIAFQLRYLDFDHYYMHSLDQYTSFYHKHWPSWMKVQGIGSMFSNPDQQSVIRTTVGTDIAIIIAPSFHQNNIFETISYLVRQFPDLTFWISTKQKHRSGGAFGQKYQALINVGMPNVKEYVGDVYDLLPRCRYLFSESSTLLAESVYFDRVALCFDPSPAFKFLYYRMFPELIFKDNEALVRRIIETRNVSIKYTDPNVKNLIFKGTQHPWDIIKSDIVTK